MLITILTLWNYFNKLADAILILRKPTSPTSFVKPFGFSSDNTSKAHENIIRIFKLMRLLYIKTTSSSHPYPDENC